MAGSDRGVMEREYGREAEDSLRSWFGKCLLGYTFSPKYDGIVVIPRELEQPSE